jgi:acyl carrier protein
MSFLDKFLPPKRPGLRYSEDARQWASKHFPESHQRIAAIAAGILCEQTGAQFSELRAATHFMNDMNVFDFFDTTDYAGAVQQEFRLKIPEHDLGKIERLSDLVEYLYEWVTPKQT